MSLSCSCVDYDGEPGTWAYYHPEDFTILETKRRKRCSSCKELIGIGSECLEFRRIRAPYTEIEENISGTEIPIASLFMCEKCGEIWLNLTAAGYCLTPEDNMERDLKEYWETTGFQPEKYQQQQAA